jgi:hypothetical protein
VLSVALGRVEHHLAREVHGLWRKEGEKEENGLRNTLKYNINKHKRN